MKRIEQHEALRIPAGWRDQERAFALQLDRVFTDIYRHFQPAAEIPEASADEYGVVKIGYTLSDKKYPVELSDGHMYVEVPWENTWRGIQDNLTSTSATDSLSANMGKKLNTDKVAKAGDTMTGNLTFKSGAGIKYEGTAMTGKTIEFYDDGDAYGIGVIIGCGGLTIVGAGESASTIKGTKAAGEENLYLGADGSVFIYSNVNAGLSTAKKIEFNSKGQFGRDSRAMSWVNGRDGAIIKNNDSFTGNQYNPVFSVKSIHGTWEGGTYTTDDIFYLTYIADSDYNSNNNRYAGQYSFKKLGNGVSKEVSDAITNITRSGTTFTATKMNGGTFTFTQQDNNTWRGYQLKDYNCQYTVNNNNFKDITASNFGVSTPSGYTPVAVCMFNPGSDKCWVSAIKADATGSTSMMTVHNPTGSNLTNTAYIKILYLQT